MYYIHELLILLSSFSNFKIESGDLGKQKVRISGDGTKISRISNFIVLSFAILSDGEKVMSWKGTTQIPFKSSYRNVSNLKIQ